MTIGIGHMEEPFTPTRILGGRIRLVAGDHQPGIETVDIRFVKNYAPPPTPSSIARLRYQIEKSRTGAKAGERRVLTAIEELKPQHTIELHGAPHVVRSKRHGADALDHETCLSFVVCGQY